MKFKHYLETITNVEIYPLISLLLFVSFFVIVTVWAIRAKDEDIRNQKNIPLNH